MSTLPEVVVMVVMVCVIGSEIPSEPDYVITSSREHLCEITSHFTTPHTRTMTVKCEGGAEFTLRMEDREGRSVLEVVGGGIGGEEVEFLKVEHIGDSMFLTFNGERFDVKDKDSEKESGVLKGLLMDQNFSKFGRVVKVIHDELQIPAWEFPSVMFLYRIGMSLDFLSPETIKKDISSNVSLLRQKRTFGYDKKYEDYHGMFPTKICKKNGWKDDSLSNLVSNRCLGTCGPSCWKCWDWVCGDCCMHTGCQRHDKFCRGSLGKIHWDCLTLRGVLWDTVTDTPYDC